MSFEQILFYAFSAVLIFSALRVITARNAIHAVLFLVLSFFTSAAIWLLLEAEFLAIALVLVYVGAVMVLFLFVVMMLDMNTAPMQAAFAKYLPLGLVVAITMVVEMGLVLSRRFYGETALTPVRHDADYSNTRELGSVLYTQYVYGFELAAVILVVAIVAAIALTMRRRPDSRYQDPSEQVVVKSSDRLRVVKMESAKPTEE
jgi:NADH-quinone oxidoreductase subunit J